MKVQLAFNISKPNELMDWSSGNLGHEMSYVKLIDIDIPEDIMIEFNNGNIRNINIVK